MIGQNKNTADIRLREGEVTILGGLSQLSDSKTVSGIPGLVDMPVLGDVLFGRHEHRQVEERAADRADPAHRAHAGLYRRKLCAEFTSGNDATVKLIRAPEPESLHAAPPVQTGRDQAAGSAAGSSAGATGAAGRASV